MTQRGRRIRAALGWLWQWCAANRLDLSCVLALSALCITVHALEPEPLEMLGDAYEKWFFVRQWFHHADFSHALWTHHMARMGVNVLAFLAQLIWGRSWHSYYIAPAFMAALQVVFVYAVGARLSGRLAGVLAALLLIYFPTAARSASQLLPDGFVGTYAIIAGYLFLRFAAAEAGTRARRAWLVGCALFCFVAYLAKETALFFVPGFVLAIWLVNDGRRDRLRASGLFLGVLLGGIALESLAYSSFTAYPHRLALIARGPHTEESWTVSNFFHLVDRFANPDVEDCLKFLLFYFLASCLGLLAFARARLTRVFLVVALSQLFFLTVTVKGLRPIALWQGFDSRYIEPSTPFALAVVGAFVELCLRAIAERSAAARSFTEPARESRARRIAGWLARRPSACVLALCLLLGLSRYLALRPSNGEGFRQNALQAALVRNAYERNLPIVTEHKPREVEAVYAFLLPDRMLVRGDQLPPFSAAKRTAGDITFLVRDPSVYRDDVLHGLVRARCAIEVSQSKRFLSLDPDVTLSTSCDELLDSLIHKRHG